MTKEEMIESIPSDLRPWAGLWLPVLLRWSEAEVTEFLMNAAGLPWIEAYRKMVIIMTTDEKIAELKMRRAELERLNQDNALFVMQQRTMFFSVIAKVIMSLGE